MVENIQNWLAQNPEISNLITMVGVIFIIIFSYIISYRLLARGLIYLAERTQSKYDDIIIQHIKPRRMALAVPVLVIYIYAYLIPDLYEFVQDSMLFVLMWLGIITLNGFLDAINDIYELRRGETGAAIRGYLDIIKIVNHLVDLRLVILRPVGWYRFFTLVFECPIPNTLDNLSELFAALLRGHEMRLINKYINIAVHTLI